MNYPSYLIHFNKNHSSKNGQFINGDGDGDGTADEHHRYTKNKKLAKYTGGSKEDLKKANRYKLGNIINKELSKTKNREYRDAAEKYRSDIQKKAEILAKEKFNEKKKKDKTLDSYDYEDMVDEFFDKYFNNLKYESMQIRDLGYNEEAAEYITRYLHRLSID